MKRALPIIIVVLVVAAGLIYYFATKNGNNSGASTTHSSSSSHMANMTHDQSNTASDAQATNTVTIKNFAFSPADITVKKGSAVTWTNQDGAAHTVTETDGQDGPKSGNLGQGQSYSFTYNTVGTFKYHCSIHPGMVGIVTVTE